MDNQRIKQAVEAPNIDLNHALQHDFCVSCWHIAQCLHTYCAEVCWHNGRSYGVITSVVDFVFVICAHFYTPCV